MGGNETEIDLVSVGKNNRKYLKDVKVIPIELQHRLVVTGVDKRRLKKIEKNKQTIRRSFLKTWKKSSPYLKFIKRGVWKLKENNIKTRFQKRVKELVDVDAPNLWNTFKNSMLQACDKVCGKKKGRKNHTNTWW